MAVSKVTTTTADLVYDGPAGATKAWAAFLSLLLVTVLPWIEDAMWAKYAAAAITLLGVLAVYGLPNKLKPTTIITPALDPDADNG